MRGSTGAVQTSFEQAGALRRPRLIAVGGGKGGVGKSFLCANLAVALAKSGYRAVLVDADLAGANLHTCLHMPAPPVSLADFVARREVDLGKLLQATGIPNLQLIAGTGAHLGTPHPTSAQREQLIEGLRRLPADFVLVDLGAGSDAPVVEFFLVSDRGFVVMTPEPTAVENAYSFLHAAFYRRLCTELRAPSVRALVDQAMDQRNERGIRTPLDLLREVAAMSPQAGTHFAAAVRAFRPRLVVNQVRTAADVKLGFAVRSVCRKYFGVDAEYAGYVNDDPAVRESVVARRPLVESHPHCDAAIYLKRIAGKLEKGMARSERCGEGVGEDA